MSPKEIVLQWVELFNQNDALAISELYSKDAVNHQVVNNPVKGRDAIRRMFMMEFEQAEMHCIIEQILEDGDWAILEWKDPLGLRGCGFFKVQGDRIIFQRGYWDRLSFMKQEKAM